MLSPMMASVGFAEISVGEVILVLALILVLVGAKKIPELVRGARDGFSQFCRRIKQMDQEAQDAGKSLGGICGKPAAQALTPDNQVAEVYDPAVLRRHDASKQGPFRRFLRLCAVIWRRLCRWLSIRVRPSASRRKWG
jgi:Sec-independent protein translocase protein TatA